jgi:FkbM family methyltransferase
MAMSLWVDPTCLEHDALIISRLLKAGEVFVDVGANIGYLTIVGARCVGKAGQVYAIEGHPRTATYLRENVLRNDMPQVAIAQVACGDRNGWAHFSDERTDDQNKVSTEGIPVPMVRLDSLFSDLRIDLLKVDVEGYEKYVIDGASGVLHQVMNLYFEVKDKFCLAAGYRYAELHALLVGQGFEVMALRSGILSKVRATDSFEACENLFATRDREELARRLGVSLVESPV